MTKANVFTSMLLTSFMFTAFSPVGSTENVVPDAIQTTEIVRTPHRREIIIPDAGEYKVLKCDFHMHTVFSDGDVWPIVRVDEAWSEGLDAIAITDHIEGEPRKQFIGGDHNSSYEIAAPAAEAKDIILVRGGEITRDVEGHYNAIFLEDVNPLDTPDFFEAIKAANKQQAFVFWNHPMAYPRPGQPNWSDTQERLVKEGLIHGIEVFNEREWYPAALDWCVERNLAVMGNSDIHAVNSEYYDLEDNHRPMTLVLARERSVESLREAMFAHRTITWFGDSLAGKQEHLEVLVRDCIILEVRPGSSSETHVVRFINKSDIPFAIESLDPNCPGHLWLAPRSSQSIEVPFAPDGNIAVTNLHAKSNEVLSVQLKVNNIEN